jgi:membrane protease subunit HflK
MYLETMQNVLSGADKVILDKNQGAVPYLPLNELRRGGASGRAADPALSTTQ